MEILENINDILSELLDVEADEITADQYLVRDLEMESIDFLELAVALNERFRIDVHDDTVFLRSLRLILSRADENGDNPLECLKGNFAYLPEDRLREILADLGNGPVLQVRDLERYVQWQMNDAKAA